MPVQSLNFFAESPSISPDYRRRMKMKSRVPPLLFAGFPANKFPSVAYEIGNVVYLFYIFISGNR